MSTFHIITLGCPRNLVDSNWIKETLEKNGFSEATFEKAACILINTCSFILPAKEESIEIILSASKERRDAKIFVLGCLAKRYGEDIFREIPEVSGVIAPEFYPRLPQILSEEGRHLKVSGQYDFLYAGAKSRATFPYAYLKLSEGCSNHCSYCAIPSIRGPLRSRSIKDIVEEAKALQEQGYKELILIGQDTTAFGLDKGKLELPTLIQELSSLEEVWIRTLYLHPEKVDAPLLEAMLLSSNFIPYFDLSIQHASPKILELMKRNPNVEKLRETIRKIREAFSEAFIRYTLLVGFPGEEEGDFEMLVNFVQETEPDYTGVFIYSEEEGTSAFSYDNKVPLEIARERSEKISRLGDELTFKRLESLKGQVLKVIVEEKEGNVFRGRFYGQAPDIDGEVFFSGEAVKRGEWAKVRVEKVVNFDLEGKALA